MNKIREILSTAKKLAAGIVWREAVLGELITYRFNSGTTITNVKCLPTGENRVDNPNPGASIRRDTLTFSIPVQDLWPAGETPSNFDTVTYNGTYYWVKSAAWDNLRAIWSITVERKKSA